MTHGINNTHVIDLESWYSHAIGKDSWYRHGLLGFLGGICLNIKNIYTKKCQKLTARCEFAVEQVPSAPEYDVYEQLL